MLLVYTVHLMSNRSELQADIAKREEAARQLLVHAAEMERLYSKVKKVVTILAGDFNIDPTDPRFASEQRPLRHCAKSLDGLGRGFHYPSA